jgi:hypothetical protein
MPQPDASNRSKGCYSITSSASASRFVGNVETESLGGLEVDDELEFCGLLDRQIAGLRAAEDAHDVSRHQTIDIGRVRGLGDEPPCSTDSRDSKLMGR